MPIYAYKCADCGHEKEVLQKVSDAPLTDCPSCGHPSMVKMVTAAGFQLKGSGWYATDFKNGSTPKKGPDKSAESATKEDSKDSKEPKAEAACGTGACPACN